MSLRAIFLPIAICVLTLFSTQSFAQNVERRQPAANSQDAEPSVSRPPNANSIEAVVNEINLLRKSLQTLNLRLREISEKLPGLDSKQSGSNEKQNRITSNLELLARAEERAGILRKQLIELIEKDTSYKSRLAQMDEEVRPENIERTLSGVGTTRTSELRDVRRRSLEIEKRGLESLLSLITQSRARLEDDVRRADSLVSRIRERLLPLIDREIDNITPN
jgi:septal ring factor EnvC (AmiA/AmiB activator)